MQTLGGLGLFLFGMAVMTGALRMLADDRLRRVLAQSVNNPWKGAATGAVSTAVLQSSSATTVAAVGFVGAGLMTFPEALGIIFGANVGTTLTGWFVAVLGFKLKLGQVVLPLILLGVLLRLAGGRRLEPWGMAVAGFGLIFVGIGVLQEGLGGLEGHVTPDQFPPDTFTGRLILVAIGLMITLVTQSSSAGVATALAAVHAETISLNQAAAMMIGMDLGTTATAALATIGANVHAKRTGFAHVIYNSLTAVAAFLLLSPYMLAVDAVLPAARTAEPELVLVGFHTFFNALGVLAVLPFTGHFAGLIVRLFPARGNPLTRQLERSLLNDPSTASASVAGTLWSVTGALLGELNRRLRNVQAATADSVLNDATDAIAQTNGYLQELATRFQPPQVSEFVAHIHVLDHLRRIAVRLQEEQRLRRCQADDSLAAMADQLSAAIESISGQTLPLTAEQLTQVRAINRELKAAMRNYREEIVRDISAGRLPTDEAIARMDTARTLRRIGYHIWRVSYHFAEDRGSVGEA